MSAAVRQVGELRRIVLTGFMGSGKTTVGRLLAARLGWDFADLDDAVSQRAGHSVPQIFAAQGEASFRQLEVEALGALLRRSELVIALGGGAPGTTALRELLDKADQTAVVYLQAPFAVLFERCCAQAEDRQATARPLLGSREAAAARYTQRESLYASIANCTVSAGLPSPENVADSILAKLPMALHRRGVPSLLT